MGKNNNNYFAVSISRYGTEDFINLLRPEQIQRSAKEKIFREMIRGQIDYGKYGKYFLDTKFLENLIIAAENELRNNTVCFNALRFYDIHFPADQDVLYNMREANIKMIAYSTILQKLQALKYTSDIGVLTDIQYVLSLQEYKNI
jgi:hypothetical protein